MLHSGVIGKHAELFDRQYGKYPKIYQKLFNYINNRGIFSNINSCFIGVKDEGINPEVMLFSIIALEKFAQKSENKATIKRKLAMFSENPLIRLERHVNSVDYTLRQVGYCARWCLDNYCKYGGCKLKLYSSDFSTKSCIRYFISIVVIIDGRKYSYEMVDVSNVNVMLNTRDVSEYLKISPEGLEIRNDAYLFESVRCTYQVNTGCWYYEVIHDYPD